MTPFSARLTFFGFVCLAGAITANALYFQEPLEKTREITGSVPQSETPEAQAPAQPGGPEDRAEAAPKGDLQPVPGGAQTAAPEGRGPRVIERPAHTVPLPPREVIRAIQRELAYRNYIVNRRDGELDTSTRIAIVTYQYDNGLTLTGRPSERLLEQILFGPFQAAPETARVARLEADQTLIARVQRILSQLGFGNLPESGRLDADTRQALREFSAFRDLPGEGRLSPRLLLELADMTDEPLVGGGAAVSGDVN